MVGAKIKDYLAEKGITQTFLSKKTGLTPCQVSDICNNDRKINCIEYYKICKALEVPLDFFFTDEESLIR